MDRRITLMANLSLAACNAAAPDASSMCNLPRTFGGWQGSTVRWHGVLLDATPHGMALIATDCQRRGIALASKPTDQRVVLALRRKCRESGIVEVDLTGKITTDAMLDVGVIHSVGFQRMSEQEERHFWTSQGF